MPGDGLLVVVILEVIMDGTSGPPFRVRIAADRQCGNITVSVAKLITP